MGIVIERSSSRAQRIISCIESPHVEFLLRLLVSLLLPSALEAELAHIITRFLLLLQVEKKIPEKVVDDQRNRGFHSFR